MRNQISILLDSMLTPSDGISFITWKPGDLEVADFLELSDLR